MRIRAGDAVALIVAVLVCLSAGAIGSATSGTAIAQWYPTLAKPWFTPSSWVFGPVWTVLYVMMGTAAFLVWRRRREGRGLALLVFAIQLVFNALWSPAFFGLRSIIAGMIVIVLLLIAVAVTTALFFRQSKVAGILMLPYLAWTSFATILNLSFLLLNR
jgi:tryptophan-rich sensory protein